MDGDYDDMFWEFEEWMEKEDDYRGERFLYLFDFGDELEFNAIVQLAIIDCIKII